MGEIKFLNTLCVLIKANLVWLKKRQQVITEYDTFNNIKEMLGLPRKFYIETRKHLGHIKIFYSE